LKDTFIFKESTPITFMKDIGKIVSEEEITNRDNWTRGRIVDFNNRKFIQTDELYTPKEPTTLDWKNLGNLKKCLETRGNILLPKIGYFEDLLTFLIEPLVKKGEFSPNLDEGFYAFLDSYYTGIHAYENRAIDFHGRLSPIEINYYPRRLEDAEGYLKYISHGGIPALIGKRIHQNY